MAILKGLQGLFMLILHIAKRNETSWFFLFLNIIYIPIAIIAICVAAISNPLIVPGLLLIGLVVSRKFDTMMRDHAEGQGDEVVKGLASQETNSNTALGFDIVDAKSQAGTIYDLHVVEAAKSRLNWSLVRDILISFAYIGLSSVWASINFTSQYPGFITTTTNIGLAFLSSVVLRWLFMGKLFRPIDAQSKKFLLQSPIRIYGQELANFLNRGGTYIVAGMLLVSSVLSSIVDQDFISVLGLVVISSVHYFIFTKIKQNVSNNTKLLILRTFDIQKNSNFTFGRLINFWEHIGNYFTVVDVSYLKHKYRLFSRRTVSIIFMVALLALMIDLGTRTEVTSYPMPTFLSTGVILIFVFALEYYQVQRGFIESPEMICQRIQKMEQRPLGLLANGVFTGVATMCRANTWRRTVEQMVSSTSIVLMDLRGFKKGKDGCKWELDYLFDNFSVGKLLILVDVNDDLTFIQDTLQDLWKTLRDNGTGNLQLTAPRIRIYQTSKQDETDVQGIFDELIRLAYASDHA